MNASLCSYKLNGLDPRIQVIQNEILNSTEIFFFLGLLSPKGRYYSFSFLIRFILEENLPFSYISLLSKKIATK